MKENVGDRYPEFVKPLDPINVPVCRSTACDEIGRPRILIMRLAAFGDVLMATPLLAALREAYPQAHITWIVERKQSDTIAANPHVDEILLFEGRYWKRLLRRGFLPIWIYKGLRFRRQLIEKDYDVFISMQPEEWPLLTRALLVKRKIGIFDTFARFNRMTVTSGYTELYSHFFTSRQLPEHRVDQYLLALEALKLQSNVSKKMHLGFTEEDQTISRAFLLHEGWQSDKRTVVIAPQTTWTSRCWPLERFAQVANSLVLDGLQIVLVGSVKEKECVRQLSRMINGNVIVSDGNLTFRQTSSLISDASLVISGDTGPMHVAAAIGTPFVAIFGPTSPFWYGPIDAKGICLFHSVPCGPCDQKNCPLPSIQNLVCMNLISTVEVLEASRKLLQMVSI